MTSQWAIVPRIVPQALKQIAELLSVQRPASNFVYTSHNYRPYPSRVSDLMSFNIVPPGEQHSDILTNFGGETFQRVKHPECFLVEAGDTIDADLCSLLYVVSFNTRLKSLKQIASFGCSMHRFKSKKFFNYFKIIIYCSNKIALSNIRNIIGFVHCQRKHCADSYITRYLLIHITGKVSGQ